MNINKKFCKTFAIITALAAAVTWAAFLFKRHIQKNRYVTLLLVTAFLAFGVPLIAYAESDYEAETYENDYAEYEAYESELVYYETEILEVITFPEITIPVISPDSSAGLDALLELIQPTTTPQTFTPYGNMQLVDDFHGETASDKQFLTVVTRNGHFFYIVIDRAADTQNVHFLNQVDEFDLWAILADEEIQPPFPMLAEATEEPEEYETEPEEPTTEQDETQGGAGGLILTLVIIGAIIGGGYYYFKVLKPQQGKKNPPTQQHNEFDFDDDDFDNNEENEIIFDDEVPDFTASDELPFDSVNEESEDKHNE